MKAVIFDMDGVLVDSEYAYLQRLTSMLQEKGFDVDLHAISAVAGNEDRLVWVMLGEILHTSFEFEKANREFEEYVQKHPVIYSELLNEGVVDILTNLKKNGFKLMLASSSPMKLIRQMMETCHLTDYFDHVLSGKMFDRTKPDPAIYNKAVELLGCAREDIVVIEDSKYGIAAAKGAGLFTLAKEEDRFFVDQQQADMSFHTFEEAYCMIMDR